MPHPTIEHDRQQTLRTQALSRLTGDCAPTGRQATASAALDVLHQLASSPATAADALTLLHELQVHQVEVELQNEELHRNRTELEADLLRLTQCHDHAPVGCFTIDRGLVLCEVNRTGARLLGVEREALPGRTLDAFLAPQGAETLRTLLAQVDAGQGADAHATARWSWLRATVNTTASKHRPPQIRPEGATCWPCPAAATTPCAPRRNTCAGATTPARPRRRMPRHGRWCPGGGSGCSRRAAACRPLR